MNVVTYLRVSSEQQAERELSIPAQRDALQRYAEERGWNIVGEYVDEAKSAKTADNRDAFQRMIAAAQQPDRTFEAVLVHKFDRFSRNRADHVFYKALLKKHGVVVLSVTEPTDPDTPHGVLLEGMLEVLSEFYNVNLKFETLKGLRENAEQGFHCGGRAPLGYRRTKIGKKVTFELGPDDEVRMIRRMFALAAQGYGGKKIVRTLREEGYPAEKLAPSTVLSLLANPVYLGHRVWNRKNENGGKNPPDEWIIAKNAHPAIIDEETWLAAQAQLNVRKVNR